ncbi:hypothetical protein H0H87_003842 [Tephrocybe sp. NHM501043]|nr:hypothetical protein H0H87_003842 [Tephrocybe sp. NHM501043]
MAFVPQSCSASASPVEMDYPTIALQHLHDVRLLHQPYVETHYPDVDAPYYTIYSPSDDPRPPCLWPTSVAPYHVSYPSMADSVLEGQSYMASHYPQVQLHAPTPLPGQPSSLLTPPPSEAYQATSNKSSNVPLNQLQLSPPSFSAAARELSKPFSESEHSATRPLPPVTFPTPSAMLAELATQSSDSKSEPVRKARRRVVAPSEGLLEPVEGGAPTPGSESLPKPPLSEPERDSISSHEKKRHYLECLEYYVIYLHQQLSLVGRVPVRLQRPTTSARGMSSQSIRTLLVHMESLNRRLNQEMLAEEQRFIHLRNMAEQLQDSQRHPTTSGSPA